MADMSETKQKAIDAFEGELKNVRFDGAPTTYSRSIDGTHFVVQMFGRIWDVWPTTDKWRCRWKADAPAKDELRGFWNSLNSAYLNHVAKLKSAAAERRLSKAAYPNPVTKAASDTAPLDRMAVLEEKVEGFYATADNLLKLIETVNNGQNAAANADRKKNMDAVSDIHSRIDFTEKLSIPSIRMDIDAHHGRLNKIENFLWSEAGYSPAYRVADDVHTVESIRTAYNIADYLPETRTETIEGASETGERASVTTRTGVRVDDDGRIVGLGLKTETVAPVAKPQQKGRGGEGATLSDDEATDIAADAAGRTGVDTFVSADWVLQAIKVAHGRGYAAGCDTEAASAESVRKAWNKAVDALYAVMPGWASVGASSGDAGEAAAAAIRKLAEAATGGKTALGKLLTDPVAELDARDTRDPKSRALAQAEDLRDFCEVCGFEGIGHSIGLLIEELKR